MKSPVWYRLETWEQSIEGKAKEKEICIQFDKQQTTFQANELRLNQLEHKQKALIAALDSMYLS